MKKLVPLSLVLILALLAGGAFFWNSQKTNSLDKELADAVAAVDNYSPSGIQADALNELKEAQGKYPAFFEGKGFSNADFSIRSDLFKSADTFKENIETQRDQIRDHLYSEYRYILNSNEKMNAIAELTDEKFVKDISDFANFNAERVELYKAAVAYCEAKPQNLEEYTQSLKLPLEKQIQTETVLKNADKNLCSEL